MKITGIGIMIGSSLDGIDLAECTFVFDDSNLSGWELRHFYECPLEEAITQKIQRYASLSLHEIALLEVSLAKSIARQILQSWGNDLSRIDFLALHGATVLHRPEQQLSIQLGDAAVLAHETDVKVISEFRKKDMLFGGIATPMIPIAEKYLYQEFDSFLNLGGIANISIHSEENIVATDICPFNQVFNYFAGLMGKPFDSDGILSRNGALQNDLLELFNSFTFFSDEAPKYLDNNWIQHEFIPTVAEQSHAPNDVMSSYAFFCAKLISVYIEQYPGVSRLLVTGGGAYHRYFMELLVDMLNRSNVEVVIPDDLIIQSKEAVLMSLTGALRLAGLPNFLPSVTGAVKAVSGGVIYEP